MHINTPVALARNCARHVIADSKCPEPFASAFAERAKCVGGLSALADSENQRLASQRRVPMAELACVFYLSRNIRQRFDQIFPHPARMQGGAATRKNDAPDIA